MPTAPSRAHHGSAGRSSEPTMTSRIPVTIPPMISPPAKYHRALSRQTDELSKSAEFWLQTEPDSA